MDTATTRAALVTRDIDAAFGGSDLLSLRDQGAVKIAYATKDDPRFLRHGVFIGSEAFIKKYPDITQRVVNQVVAAAKWGSDYDANPSPVYQLWTKSGVQFSNYREDLSSSSLKVLLSPLIDPYLVSQLKQKIKDAKRFALIKEPFDLEPRIDDRFLKQALKDQKLESHWRPVDVSGNWRVSSEAPASAPTAQLAR
jgi:sulfonate transport system substrate-binding protein